MRERSASRVWQALVLCLFAAIYTAVLLGRAEGYTFHFAPPVCLLAMAIGVLFSEIALPPGAPAASCAGRPAILLFAAFALVLPARMVWNLARLQRVQRPRAELIEAVRRHAGDTGALGLNCYLDGPSLGFIANGRDEIARCYDDHEPAASCCKDAAVYGLLAECINFESHKLSAEQAGLPLLASGEGWLLYGCGPR